jgi:hypothetical protein
MTSKKRNGAPRAPFPFSVSPPSKLNRVVLPESVCTKASPGKRTRVHHRLSSLGYFQLRPDHNMIIFQTIGRFEGFDRCSVGLGNAGQRIAGFDHV